MDEGKEDSSRSLDSGFDPDELDTEETHGKAENIPDVLSPSPEEIEQQIMALALYDKVLRDLPEGFLEQQRQALEAFKPRTPEPSPGPDPEHDQHQEAQKQADFIETAQRNVAEYQRQQLGFGAHPVTDQEFDEDLPDSTDQLQTFPSRPPKPPESPRSRQRREDRERCEAEQKISEAEEAEKRRVQEEATAEFRRRVRERQAREREEAEERTGRGESRDWVGGRVGQDCGDDLKSQEAGGQ